MVGQVNDASWAAKEQNGVQAFAAPLDEGVTDPGWLDGYTPHAEDPVTVDGHVYGARDNLAPVVFWYNKALFDQFGYAVPETWEDYQALSDKLAAEHPGYVLGSIGDPFTAVLTDMWSAQAPIYTVDSDNNFTANFKDDHTTRMIALLDHMFKNKTLTLDGLFTPDWAANHKDKVLGIPGPTWFIGGVIQNPDSLAAEPGTWAAGAPLHWAGEDVNTGNVGGGFWYGSSHSKNLEAVGKFLQYATSGPQSVKLITGLPAYQSTASEWLDGQVASGYWADSDTFKDVVTGAATHIWAGWGATLSFSSEPAWAEIVAPACRRSTSGSRRCSVRSTPGRSASTATRTAAVPQAGAGPDPGCGARPRRRTGRLRDGRRHRCRRTGGHVAGARPSSCPRRSPGRARSLTPERRRWLPTT